MFKNEFQGGSHIEVFTAQGGDPLSRWKLTGSVTREYHKDVRGYVVTMEGGSSTINTQMKLPKADKLSLGLTQSFLVFQLLVPDGSRLALELSVMDKSGSRRRIQLSSSVKEVAATPLNARVPLTSLFTGQWINLCIDVGSFVSGLFKGQVFKSLESISLGGSCMLRRIFTLRSPPPDTTGETDYNTDVSTLEELPRTCQMPGGVAAIHTQVFGYGRVVSPSTNRRVAQKPVVNGTQAPGLTATTIDERPMHIAFGKKVAIPDHILNSRQSGKQSIADPILSVGVEEISADGQRLQPRPPSKPADPRVLKIQKKRVRIISGGKQASLRAAKNNAALQQSKGNAKEIEPIDSGSGNSLNISTGTSVSVIDSGYEKSRATEIHSHFYDQTMEQEKSNIQIATSVLAVHNTGALSTNRTSVQENGLALDEQLALDVLKYKDTMSEAAHHLLDEHDDEMISDSGLNEVGNISENAEELLDTTSDSKEVDISGVQHSQLEQSLDEVLYSYRSLPKSAERRQTDVTGSLAMDVTGRSAGLDEDFISSFSNNEQGSPRKQHKKIDEASGDIQRKETRLSDDYDWWQYASVDDTDITQSEPSLRTRLANAGPSQKTLSTGPPRHSSEMERTLSGSVTLSGWTEKFNDASRNPLHDSLDTREMGGMLSPLMGTLTDGPTFPLDPVDSSREGEELELLYDPQLNCFYDPVTFKYYELAQ